MKKFLLLILALVGVTIFALPLSAQETDLPANFPPITVTSTEGVANGNLYLGVYSEEGVVTGYGNYVAILDNDGQVLFQHENLPMRAYDFRPYPNGYMSYYQQTEAGIGGRGGFGLNGYIQMMDIRGTPFQQYTVQEPLTKTGAHEHQLLENGNMILIAHDVREMDLTEFGGVANAIVVTTSLQEVTPEGEVVWFWDGWEHLSLEDCVFPDMLTREPPAPVAYAHINGFTLTPDGDIIASVRHFDQVIKIDRETGDILWRLGGAKAIQNDFTFIDDPYNGTSHQHNPTLLPNGNLLLFDNGNLREPKFSRVVEYALDEEAMTATLVWSYDAGETRFAERQGSAQRLPNGNTLIGWGIAAADGKPAVSEVTPEGEEVLTVTLPPDFITYRAYKIELMEGY